MSQIVSTPFSENWNTLISPEREALHKARAFGCRVAAIAVIVSTLALSIFLAITFVEFVPLVLAGTLMLTSPAIRLCQYFYGEGSESLRLETQIRKVRENYKKLQEKGSPKAESTALCQYQETRTKELYEAYEEAHKKAVDFEEKTPTHSYRLNSLRVTALNAEKTALASKVFSVFLNALAKHPESFEKAITKYGLDLSVRFSKCIQWDHRDADKRVMDIFFRTKKDPLASFLDSDQTLISYQEVKELIHASKPDEIIIQKMENKLYQAFIEKEAQ